MKSSGNLLENIKHTNIHIIWVPEGEEWQIGAEKLEAIIAKHITNMGKETDIQVQEEQNPEKDEHKEFHTKGLKVKMAKIKDSERIFLIWYISCQLQFRGKFLFYGLRWVYMGQLTQAFKMKTEVCVKGKPVMSFISHALMWGIEIITSRRIIALGTVGTREAARC